MVQHLVEPRGTTGARCGTPSGDRVLKVYADDNQPYPLEVSRRDGLRSHVTEDFLRHIIVVVYAEETTGGRNAFLLATTPRVLPSDGAGTSRVDYHLSANNATFHKSVITG